MTPTTEPGVVDCGEATCIIGAGPGGLSAARALKAQGLPYEQFERHHDVGGLWDMDNPGSPIYESAHFISSRDLSGFMGFPMPKHFPDYPSHRQILSYVRSFADAYGLRAAIRLGTGVNQVRKDAAGHWVVELSDGTRRRYKAVICATGCNWDPNLPKFEGRFSGELRHSVTYRSGDEFRGKRVLVVGAGNSGADIACDAATHADQAFISVRRGYHFIPKHIFGMPADEFGESGPHLPLWLARPIMTGLLRLMTGDLTRFGLPRPDHRLFESHPLMNSQLLHHLQHGNIAVKPDISHLDGHAVVFKDGSREEVDLVLCATGYRWSCRYAAEYFEWRGGRPQLYLSMFSRDHRNLFGIGYLENNSSAYKLFDTQAFMIAAYLKAQRDHDASAARFEQLIQRDQPDLSGGIRFVDSPRHQVYIDAHSFKTYLRKLRARMGWNELSEAFYDRVRVASSAAVPGLQAPVREVVSHG
ncbi:NAD(P)-binding domain-containing protein [Hydrogenophaga taeniospiralis]|uniref:flavin-containing monooxygenase n=1 Tax=Hydrogenophaga taeniospiralis TaxID=65656 RepID=UPI001CFAAFC9|nr:NAD(P)-binding domain-containing protein [Hydrogenophaga taeniospiralis]MCB4362128.1 NAD(P)-binding domain-containing protein [Hydrogenophaga taeniospiralis]